MRTPDYSVVSELASWQTKYGVISIYLPIDHSERRQGWKVVLRDELKQLTERAHQQGPRELWQALQATSERVIDRFTGDGVQPRGRCQIAFVEVAERPARDTFFESQLALAQAVVVHDTQSHVLPLLKLLDDGAPLGVLAVSGERVRLWDWRMGEATPLARWEFTPQEEPHERKGPTIRDPARSQGTTSSGRDQFDSHLENQRERFLRTTGQELSDYAPGNSWREIICFGDEVNARRLADGFGPHPKFRHIDDHNVLGEEDVQVAQRVERLLDELNSGRELELVERAKNAVYAEGGRGGALGVEETVAALIHGRVEHLLLDAERDYSAVALSEGLAAELSQAKFGHLGLPELMIDQAMRTNARVTPLERQAATALAESDGVAAILRY
jgi:Bacterial archaeo-eukaryotic release factor family 10